MEERRALYQAYLLRLWREPQDQIWRASLKTMADDQELAFANLDDLFVYLLRRTETMGEQRQQVSIAQGEMIMDTDDVQFTPQEDALHLLITHDAIRQMTLAGNDAPTDDQVDANGSVITAALEKAGLVSGYAGTRLGLAFAVALIRRRGDVFTADAGSGIYWPIAWNVFGALLSLASQRMADFPDLEADMMSEMADSLQAWHAPMPL